LATLILSFPVAVCNLLRLIRRQRIDLVHTNTGVMPAPALAAKLARRPHVWHIRDSFHEFRSLWPLYRRYITALSSRVICVSNPIAGQFPNGANITVIHNGVPLEEFPVRADELRARFREKFRLGDALVVGCVGRIKFVRKGQEVLMRAAALLKQRGLVAKYVIVGTTSPGNEGHLSRLQQLIGELGLTADVLLTGELADPRPAYAAMDVFVLPSAQPEPFGGVVLEAMAMQLPVIATAVGGSLDQVVDGKTGFLVPPANAEALAEKLEVLIRDSAARQQMGKAARIRLETCFSITRMVEKIKAVYEQAIVGASLVVFSNLIVSFFAAATVAEFVFIAARDSRPG
jgi:glycosyltransferase involved in cell wall biosynthesis